jgi:predicted branched-subunit amino acid permease
VLWNLATLIGAVAGSGLGDPRTFGFDAAVPAAFLALLWPRLDSRRARLSALAAAALALSLVPVARPGVPIIAAAGIALLAAWHPDRSEPTAPSETPRQSEVDS